MGIYDRDYYQEPEPGIRLTAPRTMVTTLVLINVGVYLLDWLTGWQITEYAELKSNVLRHPLQLFTLLTSGFLHDSHGIFHLIFNIFALWIFGREVETIYGKWEFLRMYLVFIVLASLGWVVSENVLDPQTFWNDGRLPTLVGASGGVSGILVIFVLLFPRRMFYIWGVIPMPAWLFLVIFLLVNASGFLAGPNSGDNTAFAAHLVGAGCGALYLRSGINFGRWFPEGASLRQLGPRRLRVHDPEAEERELNQQVDAILAKIHVAGESSLTRKERRVLEAASRKAQEKRR